MSDVLELNDRGLIDQWLDKLGSQNVSKNTLVAYTYDLELFYSYCEKHQLLFSDIELSDMRAYIGHCVESCKYSNPTIQRFISSIRGFMQWLQLNQHLNINPATDLKVKKKPAPIPHILSIEDMNRLIDQPEPEGEYQQWLWKRDKAIFELLYSSGLRVSELTALKMRHIDFNQKTVRVESGKGNKDRIVPLGGKAILALQTWFIARSEKSPLDQHIFIDSKGRNIKRVQVFNRIKIQAVRAGISENVYPHLIRHCFATHMLSASGDIRAVQEMLGHANIKTTETYTHVDFDRLAQVYDQAHPRASKKSK